jgi:hypothetical protein
MKLIVGKNDCKACNGTGVTHDLSVDKNCATVTSVLCSCATLVDIPGSVEPEKERVFTDERKVTDPADNPEPKEVLK